MPDSTSNAPKSNVPKTNVPEYSSVSELSFNLKRTLEDSYGRIRVRGELSRVKIHSSGHMYSDLKDDQSVINVVCWRSTLAKLSIKPEEGLDVICTGKVSSYPARSNYQLIIESIELAGEGALLKLLEERKKRLAAEGLFDESRKKDLPFLPDAIGVITSPTGAVIQDIMHRLNDRFPRHVYLWPVHVQGDRAAQEVIAAIKGFDGNLPDHIKKPDVLIIARGGGSLEDLMPFNDEDLVRAVADCSIPVISAIGHETDTTLIDYVSDKRAPTPTGAAEIAVPRRVDIMAGLMDFAKRLHGAMMRHMDMATMQISHMSSRLGDPRQTLDIKTQQLDFLSEKMDRVFDRSVEKHQTRLISLFSRLVHPKAHMEFLSSRLSERSERLANIGQKILEKKETQLHSLERVLENLSFKRILDRGYTVIRDKDNKLITNADDIIENQDITVEFKGNKSIAGILKPAK